MCNFRALSPMTALIWGAVLNGVVAVPVMVVMMLMAKNRPIMGEFCISGLLNTLGWFATAVMGFATIAFILTITHAL